MKILVLVNKPDEDDAVSNDISILDTDNENALEAALRIKDKDVGTEVIAVTAGSLDATDMLRECIAKGADDGILLSDENFDYENPRALASILAAGIKKLGSVDLVIAGSQSFDLGIIQITPQLSYMLDMPLIFRVSEFCLSQADGSDSVQEGETELIPDEELIPEERAEFIPEYGKVSVKSDLENCTLDLISDLPCILSVTRDINTPRYTTVPDMLMSLSAEIKTMNGLDLGLDDQENRSELFDEYNELLLSFPPKPRESGITITGDTPEDIAGSLMDHLRKKAVL